MFPNLSLQSFASIARDKLHSSASYGVRDNARLHRWVLLKNSLTNALSRSTETPPPPTTTLVSVSASAPELSSRDDEYDAFLFPDGDVFAESFVDTGNTKPESNDEDRHGSEAQWLNSLLESLDDNSETDTLVTVVSVDADADEEEDEESDLMSLLDLPDSMASSTPESILLPPSPPLSAFDSPAAALHNFWAHQRLPLTYTSISSDISDDIDALALPDVIEDSSSDTDSESLNTPFTRSTSSLGDAQRQPFVRIVEGEPPIHSNTSQYPYEFEAGIDTHHHHPSESFEQEC